jgi:murein L,D-transpeptidase YafK
MILLLAATVASTLLRAPDSARVGRSAMPPLTRAGSRTADSIVVEKQRHRLTLYRHGQLLRSYRVALGRHPIGDKVHAGDGRTPEGVFTIDSRNAQSRYHLALHISYPDHRHRARARARGISPGGSIMIHGLPQGFGDVGAAHRDEDWTEGCIAVTNEEIEEIWRTVPVGTRVLIKP